MNFSKFIFIVLFSMSLLHTNALAVERFPPPQFETGYQLPQTIVPPAKTWLHEYIDVFVLFLALSISSYLVFKHRTRRAIFIMMLCSLAYFGFYRKGCICSIGAIQNIVLSIADAGYAITISALLFFMLPLVFSLFFGRVFCASVCPLGALQDIVALKPVSVPVWLESSLRFLAYAYLAFAVLFAATGSAFIICRYDPFVPVFRLTGNINILVITGCILAIGLFIVRPYCRYLCPYGIILRQLSRISKYRVMITPDDCIKCRLCEDSCPFAAIEKPTAKWPAKNYHTDKKTLALCIISIPILIIVGGFLLSSANNVLARVHPDVRLAERIYLEQTRKVTDTTDQSNAFRTTARQIESLYADADNIRAQFKKLGWFIGGFLGLVIALKLIKNSIHWTRTEYTAHKADCLACGRCFEFCPREHARRKTNNQTHGDGL